MKLRSLFFSYICTLAVFTNSCRHSGHKDMPAPGLTTHVREDSEEGENAAKRDAWIELLHGGRQENWSDIESQNQEDKYIQWLRTETETRGGEENVAGGRIRGIWRERGSINNAGSIMAVDFWPDDETVFAVGAGGPIFKGDLSGFGWQVVNDKLRFSTDLLKAVKMDDGSRRLISAVNGIPHYSDDDGITWSKATGVVLTTDGWALYHSQVTQNGTIFFLGRKDYNGTIRVYTSYDKGKTYKSLKIFLTSDTRNLALTMDAVTNDVYVVEQVSASKSNLYKHNPQTRALESVTAAMPIGYGENGRANLQAVTYRDTLRLYTYLEDLKLMYSRDAGKTWTKLSTLPTDPWDIGLYVCPSNPRNMFYGEVNCYRSPNGGQSFHPISEWWEYYGDIYTKLHADIMTIREFKKSDGTFFLLNANHGGLYYTEDYGSTHFNIGLYNLNVSQYYDVKSYPPDPRRVFAGSQDQGQQRGIIDTDEAAELYQNISGDYGHIVFTGSGKHLWSVYPGGSIGYYSQPLSQESPVAGYEIKSSNETVWIPPIIPSDDEEADVVYAAGGSTIPTSGGSHILRLEYKNGDIAATQLPFNFAPSGGQISAMAIDPHDYRIWYVATTNGKFYRSVNNGTDFTKTAEFLSEAHYLYGSCILPSAVTPGVVYLSGNGYTYKPVYRSTDGGLTFEEFSDGLPKTTVFKIVANKDESLIFAATEAGPYVYIKKEGKWFDLSGSATPNQTYWSVEYIPSLMTARFGTYGRGIWDFEVREVLSANEETTTAAAHDMNVYPNPSQGDGVIVKSGSLSEMIEVGFYDMTGRLVKTTTTLSGASINTFGLKAGSYRIRIKGRQSERWATWIKL